MSIRQDIVSSAVSFLRDPSVASSPLAKRLVFLESKGLTPAETDEALRQASTSAPSQPSWSGGGLPMQQRGRYGRPEEVARDWRDWFVMTVIGGGVGWLVVSLARKYLVPALQPPSQTDLEMAQAALTAKYDEAAAILETLQTDTGALKEDLASQREKVEGAIKEVHDAMEQCMKGETERDEEMDKIREEVESLKEMLPRMLEKQKDAQTASLTDLQNELKSLKSLLLSRRPEASSSGSTTPTPAPAPAPAPAASRTSSGSRFGYTGSPAFAGLGNRPPGIPAWQLAAAAAPAAPLSGETTTTSKDSPVASATSVNQPKPQGVPVEAVNERVGAEAGVEPDKVNGVTDGDGEAGASLGVAGA